MNTKRCLGTFGSAVSTTLLVAACATPPTPRMATPSMSSDRPAAGSARAAQPEARAPGRLGRTLPELIKDADVPGLTVAVIRDGETSWQGAYGLKNAETHDAVTSETVFEAASLSKPVFAYAVLRLVERGELDLDAPLWDTLPYERLAHDERARAITARIALSHQSGLPNWGGTPLEMSFAPGERWSYSGEGYVYLQKTLEKATGLDLDVLVRREVFEPLGMSHSSFVWREDYDTAAATPHGPMSRPRPKNQPDANAASSLHTTAGDYARFMAAMLKPAPAERALVRRMLEPQARVRNWGDAEPAPHLHWGLGWGLQDDAAGKAFWHWGDNGTFRCYVVGYPATGDGLVYFTNSENGLSIAGRLTSAVFPGHEQPAVDWLDYEAYDDPGRLLMLRLEKAFLDQGHEKGLELFRRLPREGAEAMDASVAPRVARRLVDHGRVDDAVALLEDNVTRFPDDLGALRAVGQAMIESGNLERALETFREVSRLDPDDDRATAQVEWARLGLAARDAPVEVPVETLARYAGGYGPRQVTLEESRLRYVRRGRDTYYWLAPLTLDTFALEGLPSFRLRFVSDSEGGVVKVEGHYSDGRTDESPRDP